MMPEWDDKEKSLLTRTALEAGIEYHQAFRQLLGEKRMRPDDPRVRLDVINPRASVKESQKAFMEEAWCYHEAIRQRSQTGDTDMQAHYRPVLAMQTKILKGARHATEQGSNSAAGALALSFEETGLDLLRRGESEHFCRELFRFSGRAVDRSVLSDRHRNWNGLVSPIALDNGLTREQATAGLVRAGLIEEADRRVGLDPEHARGYNLYTSPEFLSHINATYWGNMHLLRPVKSQIYSRRAILEDIADLPRRGEKETGDLERNRRQEGFMRVIASVGERMALNIGHRRTDPEGKVAACMHATSASAVDRGIIFRDRAMAFEQEQARAQSLERRGERVI